MFQPDMLKTLSPSHSDISDSDSIMADFNEVEVDTVHL